MPLSDEDIGLPPQPKRGLSDAEIGLPSAPGKALSDEEIGLPAPPKAAAKPAPRFGAQPPPGPDTAIGAYGASLKQGFQTAREAIHEPMPASALKFGQGVMGIVGAPFVGAAQMASNATGGFFTPDQLLEASMALGIKAPGVRAEVPSLTVARRMPDGSVVKGKPGDIHSDLVPVDEAIKRSSGELSPPQLVVARRMPDGSVKIGKGDQVHTDLMTKRELADNAPPVPDEQMGYATKDGKFLPRKEALEWASKNEPERVNYSMEQPENGLEAGSYLEARGYSPRQVEESIKVGDRVHWQSAGVDQFKEPRAVKWVSEDGNWAMVEGSDTGLPMSELTREGAAPGSREKQKGMSTKEAMSTIDKRLTDDSFGYVDPRGRFLTSTEALDWAKKYEPARAASSIKEGRLDAASYAYANPNVTKAQRAELLRQIEDTTEEVAQAQRDQRRVIKPGEGSFTTSKGSTYTLHVDGTTTRNKAARADLGHEGDSGPKERTQKTVYASPESIQALAPPEGAVWRIIDNGDGTLSLVVKNSNGKWGISPSQRNVKIETSPKVGLHPLELWKNTNVRGQPAFRKMHPGNPITELKAGEGSIAEKRAKLSKYAQGLAENLKHMQSELEHLDKTPENYATGSAFVNAYGGAREAAKAIERIFSPSTVSKMSLEAHASIREAGGGAARATATADELLEPFRKQVNALSDFDKRAFIDYVESRSEGTKLADETLQPIADVLRSEFKKREAELKNLSSTKLMDFVEDYYAHMWKDPSAAANEAMEVVTGGRNPPRAARQGSGASLRKRTVPTMSDGYAAGLVPVTENPIDAAMLYFKSMDQFIAATSILDTAKEAGIVKYIKPKMVGASGHPESFKVPEGYAPINGRAGVNASGARAYAPEDWARVYNNYIDLGLRRNKDVGAIFETVQKVNNAITALELFGSGYHAFTMANEAIISGVAKGIGELAGGKPIKAVGSIATAPAEPIRAYLRGKKVEKVYLGTTEGSEHMRKVVDLLEKAGGRAVGKRHSFGYHFSSMDSFWTSFKRGALKMEMQRLGKGIQQAPISGTYKAFFNLFGRTMETVAQPLFEKYIPRLKNGAFYDTMSSWLETHPAATEAEQTAAARSIWDSIDNRFGELVQDNVFWNRTLKQLSQLAMRSYSWNLGTVREIGGGLVDIAGTVVKGKEWSSRASYVVAMPLVVGTINAIYQYIKTGEHPKDVTDLVAGRTGGQVPGFGGRGKVPERGMLPGYQKDVLGWYEDWRREASNKLSTGVRAAIVEPMMNQDWQGNPVFHKDNNWLVEYFQHVINALGPISFKTAGAPHKKGSNIGPFEGMTGIRPAPAAVQDPKGTARGLAAIARRRELREKKQTIRQHLLYEQ